MPTEQEINNLNTISLSKEKTRESPVKRCASEEVTLAKQNIAARGAPV